MRWRELIRPLVQQSYQRMFLKKSRSSFYLSQELGKVCEIQLCSLIVNKTKKQMKTIQSLIKVSGNTLLAHRYKISDILTVDTLLDEV